MRLSGFPFWVTLLLAMTVVATPAMAQDPPQQAELILQMPPDDGESRDESANLDQGDARVSATATNRGRGDTVRVRLRFSYRIEPDTIALDEIIDRIVIETLDAENLVMGNVEMDPNEVNLNPNRVALVYLATLYRPAGDYVLRVRVFGNYE